MQLFDQYREKYYRIVRENNDWKDRNRKLCELQLDSKQYFILDLNDNEKIIALKLVPTKIIDTQGFNFFAAKVISLIGNSDNVMGKINKYLTEQNYQVEDKANLFQKK
jgi:hypothetical protein